MGAASEQGYMYAILLLLVVLLTSECGAVRRSIVEPAPSNGTQRLLVLTVEYPNQQGKYTGSQWKNGLFAELNTFYLAQSYNTLRYEVDVVTIDDNGNPVINNPAGKSYIPLMYNISTYANGQHGWKFDTQWSLSTIVRHAAAYLDSRKFSWAPYIQSGKVQNVVIMSAGIDYRYAEETESKAENNYLLSTSIAGANYLTPTGAYLSSFTFCSEHTQRPDTKPLVMAHLRQSPHEYSDTLGLPDLYDISEKSTGVGYFDLLGYGVYANGNSDGTTPVGLGAYPKTTLGWAQPVVITNSTQVKLGPSSLAPGNFLQIFTNASGIYYLVENRQPVDQWDKNFVQQYTSGILIWRIDGTNAKKFTTYNHVNTYCTPAMNNCPATPAIILEEADGKQDMSTPGLKPLFGTAADVWQVGEQFIGENNVSIALMDLQDQVFTIYVSFEGPVVIPDRLHSSGYVQYPIILLLLTAILLVLL